MAEPCFACGGHREECILYFFMCTLIFMYMPPDILVLTVVVLLDFSGLNKTDTEIERIEALWIPAIHTTRPCLLDFYL